jgi:hypothetical protein
MGKVKYAGSDNWRPDNWGLQVCSGPLNSLANNCIGNVGFWIKK